MFTVSRIIKIVLVLTLGRCTQGFPVITSSRPYLPGMGTTKGTDPIAIPIVQRNPLPHSTTCMYALPEVSFLAESSSSILLGLENVLTNENIKKAFSLGTFGPQLLWLLMILVPKSELTKKVMGGYTGILFFSLVHLFVVVASATQQDGTAPLLEFQGVFDASPDADPQGAMMGMMRYPNFVTEEWTHVLTWDLFVGRWIWLDGLKRNIFTSHSVLLCNLIGPPGLLLHFLTSLISSKGFPPSEPEE